MMSKERKRDVTLSVMILSAAMAWSVAVEIAGAEPSTPDWALASASLGSGFLSLAEPQELTAEKLGVVKAGMDGSLDDYLDCILACFSCCDGIPNAIERAACRIQCRNFCAQFLQSFD